MKILVLHSRYLSDVASGENRVVMDEVRLLREGGHEVHLWDPSPRDVTGLGLIRTGARAVWSPRAVGEVARAVRQRGIDVVHCHNLFPELSPAVLRAAAAAGAAVVVTLHNYRFLCLPSNFLRDGAVCESCLGGVPWRGVVHRCYRGSAAGSGALAASLTLHRWGRTFEKVSLFLAVSRFVRDKHLEAGWPSEGIRVKPHFTWPAPRRDGPGRYFLFLGRLSPEKGAQTIVPGWRAEHGRLVVAGGGPQAPALRSVAPSSVEFLGPVSFDDVPEVIRGARAVLIPSVSYETFGRSILEAYAAGVPVIASRTGGIPEVVQDGVTGLLVPPADGVQWAQAVERLLDDPESERLGEGAYQLWRKRYGPEAALSNLTTAYREALITADTPIGRDSCDSRFGWPSQGAAPSEAAP